MTHAAQYLRLGPLGALVGRRDRDPRRAPREPRLVDHEAARDRGGDRGRAGGSDAIEAAITRSDNDAALRLWGELDDGAAEVEAQLRAAGDHETTLEREPDPRGYSSFGRTVWSLPAAVRFYGRSRGELLPPGETARILDAMRRIAPEQRWGLGAADPPIPFKGGWGPSESPGGGYEVIQVGISGPTVIAIAARAQDFGGGEAASLEACAATSEHSITSNSRPPRTRSASALQYVRKISGFEASRRRTRRPSNARSTTWLPSARACSTSS